MRPFLADVLATKRILTIVMSIIFSALLYSRAFGAPTTLLCRWPAEGNHSSGGVTLVVDGSSRSCGEAGEWSCVARDWTDTEIECFCKNYNDSYEDDFRLNRISGDFAAYIKVVSNGHIDERDGHCQKAQAQF